VRRAVYVTRRARKCFDIEVDVVLAEAEPSLASVLAELHREGAIAGYAHIFPGEAPTPTLDELLGQWQDLLRVEAESWVFVAREAHDVVGVVAAGRDPDDSALGNLARLYVKPSRWGLGVGRLLYGAALSHLQTIGFRQASLWVLEGNARARSWYERLGWRPTGERRPVFARAGIDDLRDLLML
jgi:ribosomal protein S18 acetylase RimI-like enzyme